MADLETVLVKCKKSGTVMRVNATGIDGFKEDLHERITDDQATAGARRALKADEGGDGGSDDDEGGDDEGASDGTEGKGESKPKTKKSKK